MRTFRYSALFTFIPTLLAFGDVDPQHACIQNLRQLDGAKEHLRLEQKLQPGDVVGTAILAKCFTGGLPTCPSGGQYTLGPIGVYPMCSVPGHSEEALKRAVEKEADQTRLVLIGTGTVLAALVAGRKMRTKKTASLALQRTPDSPPCSNAGPRDPAPRE